jgi:hypothetical protein
MKNLPFAVISKDKPGFGQRGMDISVDESRVNQDRSVPEIHYGFFSHFRVFQGSLLF